MKQWARIIAAVRAKRSRRWAYRTLLFFVAIALLGRFLANDRPLVAKYQTEVRWPVFHQLGEEWLGISPYTDLPGRSWKRAEMEWAIWPPVPYTASEIDGRNNNYRSPFSEQRVESTRWRHWLGTDKLGRDVLAGLIRGTRTALLVGLVAMSVALFIGLLVGGLSGYFGDQQLRRPRWKIYGTALGLLLGGSYFAGVLAPWLADSGLVSLLVLGLSTLLVGILIFTACFFLLSRFIPWLSQPQSIPVDFLGLRLIELFNSVPALVLLISVLSVLNKPTIITVMLIIGLVRWTGIARFVRAELLRIRHLPYLEAAKLSGLSDARIFLRHALPNTLGPVIVAVAFGMAGAVLLEAFLAFLGVGLPPDQVSWGTLLLQARGKPDAWWLTVFPGLAIFVTVLSLNLLGEALRE